jgi:hypothetical protein
MAAGAEAGSMVEDSHANQNTQPRASDESPSETHAEQSVAAGATDVKTTQALTITPGPTSPRKAESNRTNAQKSTGPKTDRGKAASSGNSTRYGLLSRRIPKIPGKRMKDFSFLLASLQQDVKPVGMLEEILVERMAHEDWLLEAARWHEAELLDNNDCPFGGSMIDRILRYRTTINRQFYQAMNQLERLQRLRKGDHVPAPVNLQISHDTPPISEEEN